MGTPGGTPDAAAAPEDTSGAARSSATGVVGEVVGMFANLSDADVVVGVDAVGPKLVGTPDVGMSDTADAAAVGVVEVVALGVSVCCPARRFLGHTSSVGSQQLK